MNRLTRRATLGAAAAFTIAPSARAQAYPAKPMRFLVPYPVGGIVDIVTRCLAEPMQVDLGQPVVVEPKPGGNSTLATAMIQQAPADGYNSVMATISHVVVPHLQSVPYDALADFQPVALVAMATSVATVNPSVLVKTLKELVEYGRANPGKLNYLNPAGTPAVIVERLHGSAMKSLQQAETRDRLAKAACEVPAPRTLADVATMWKADYARFGKLVKEAGIKGET
jgi:tripartite-type tricarboxylate transporter receptor subunit TctC